MNVVILSVGDELAFGQTVDTNSAWLSRRLADLGVVTAYHKTVADDVDAIAGAVTAGCRDAELVIMTGGLGPTADDLTRQALAKVAGKPLDMHPPSLERIRIFFAGLGREMPAVNRCQALFPRGTEVLDNDWGTAPGIRMHHGKASLYSFPGVPREMMAMFDRHVAPALARLGRRLVIVSEVIHTFGAGESSVAEKLAELMKRERNPLVGTTVSGGIVSVRIRSEFPTSDLARRQLGHTVEEVKARLGALVFGSGSQTLAAAVGEMLRRGGATVATAESCTGGLLSKMFTDVSGSSDYFRGGWIVYSNVMKQRELGVAEELIERVGAVSRDVAEAMACGALQKSGSDYALAVTGIAGPTGGSDEKPVGTVWIALASCGSGGSPRLKSEMFRFPGERDMIRDRAAKTAMNLLRLALAGA